VLSLLETHEVLAWVVVGANAAVGVWALGAHWLAPLRWRGLWAAVAAAQALLFVQAGVGAALFARITGPAPRMHMFYGFLTLVMVALLYGYRQPLGERRYVLYGLGSLFIMGLSLQAMTNAGQLS
jgi:hypothetical protein